MRSTGWLRPDVVERLRAWWGGARVRIMKLTALAAVVVLALAGCSNTHQIDRVAWGQELATQGVTVSDWPKLEKSVLSVCAMDDPSTFLAVATDGGTSLKTIETNYRNVCPDRMDRFQAAVKSMAEAKGSTDLACSTPADKRTQDQADLAAAMNCP